MLLVSLDSRCRFRVKRRTFVPFIGVGNATPVTPFLATLWRNPSTAPTKCRVSNSATSVLHGLVEVRGLVPKFVSTSSSSSLLSSVALCLFYSFYCQMLLGSRHANSASLTSNNEYAPNHGFIKREMVRSVCE